MEKCVSQPRLDWLCSCGSFPQKDLLKLKRFQWVWSKIGNGFHPLFCWASWGSSIQRKKSMIQEKWRATEPWLEWRTTIKTHVCLLLEYEKQRLSKQVNESQIEKRKNKVVLHTGGCRRMGMFIECCGWKTFMWARETRQEWEEISCGLLNEQTTTAPEDLLSQRRVRNCKEEEY